MDFAMDFCCFFLCVCCTMCLVQPAYKAERALFDAAAREGQTKKGKKGEDTLESSKFLGHFSKAWDKLQKSK